MVTSKEPYVDKKARKAAGLIARLDQFGDLNKLRNAIEERREKLRRSLRDQEIEEAWGRMVAAGSGSTWTKNKNVFGGSIPAGKVLELGRLQHGRKYIGGWFHVEGENEPRWINGFDFPNLVSIDVSAETAEEKEARESAAKRERSMIGRFEGMVARMTDGAKP